LKELTEKYSLAMDKFEANRAGLLKEARKEAAKIIEDSNRLIENTIKEIREAQAEKEHTRQLREKLRDERTKIDQDIEKAEKKSPDKTAALRKEKKKKPEERIQIGNRVRIPPQQTVGEVVDLSDGDAVVSFGSMVMRVSKDKLVNVGEEEFHQKVLMRRSNYGSIINELNEKQNRFSHTLDLRGVRAEEAVGKLQKYIDEALLLSAKELKILHGKGSGILRDVIRQQLRAMPEVQHFADEHVERGGSGITIVRLK
ncbi:MAG: Smr/MutS family protein, partial [Bacteroidales bacterium]